MKKIFLPLSISLIAAAVTASVQQGADGPSAPVAAKPLRQGSVVRGKDVFRHETFGTEGFWTDAVRVPQGLRAARMTALKALKLGINLDVESMPAALRARFAREARTDLSPAHAPTLNDPKLWPDLVRMDAVIGLVERRGKTGIACAFCHTITDKAVFSWRDKGSIGRRIDGPTPHSLEVGQFFALAANSRALFPLLQLDLGGGASIGKVAKYHFTPDSTEAEVDAYLNDPQANPPGTFDETPDGVGNPVHILPLFRQDLAAPFSTSGQNDQLDDMSNTIWTALFDQTDLITPNGRKFLHVLGGAAGDGLADGYAKVLTATHVTGYPYIHAQGGLPVLTAPTPLGLGVDRGELLDFNAYVASLRPPKGVAGNPSIVAQGRSVFRAQCTSCHNVDSSKPVDARLIPMEIIWPGYRPTVIAKRPDPLTPIQNSPGGFDDKMIVVDASPVGGPRGTALPLLMDLARKPVFLHDDSIRSLESLLNPARGAKSPHPFYIAGPRQRKATIVFLRSLDDRKPKEKTARSGG